VCQSLLGLTDDTVTRLQQQITQAEQAIQEKKELKEKIQQLEDNTRNQEDTSKIRLFTTIKAYPSILNPV
jgi:hypothetical protein